MVEGERKRERERERVRERASESAEAHKLYRRTAVQRCIQRYSRTLRGVLTPG